MVYLAFAAWYTLAAVLVVPAHAASPCAATLCVLEPTGRSALQARPGTIAVTGAILVNSTNSQAALADGASGTAGITATTTIGGPAAPGGFVATHGGAFSPIPVNQPAGTDPFATLALCPAATECPTAPPTPFPNVSLTGGSAAINPGVYGNIAVSGGGHLTLNPGIYVLVIGVTASGSGTQLTGSGVTLYLACPSYPLPCSSTISGAFYSAENTATVTITAPTSGTYAGLSIVADRLNAVNIRTTGSAITTASGVYAASANLTITGPPPALPGR